MIRIRGPVRPETPAPGSVQIFSNDADLPIREITDELRATGTTVRSVARAGGNGNSGDGSGNGDDAVIGNGFATLREWRDWAAARNAHVLMAGRPTPLDLARRAAMLRRARTVHLWVERPPPGNALVRSVRRSTVGAWGLDGIFSAGTRRVDGCRTAVGSDVPVHVLPPVTDRGTDHEPEPATRPTIGFAGALLSECGLDVVVRALAQLPASDRLRLQVIGAGPDRDRLATKAQRLGIERWIDWLGDVEGSRLDAIRAKWWAVVVPRQRSGRWELGVHAALNSGVPVIAAHDVHAAVDLVRPGFNGLIVAANDRDRWAAAIGQVADRASREGFSSAAREVGRAFAPFRAAAWLRELLDEAGTSRLEGGGRLPDRSFVEHAWSPLGPDRPGPPENGPTEPDRARTPLYRSPSR